MIWVIGSFLAVVASGALFLWACSLVRKLARSRLVIRQFENAGYKDIRCPSCTLGTQYLDQEKGWGPIPVPVRMIVSGRPWKNAGQANCRRCNDCGGNGYTATRDYTVPNTGLRELT